MKSIGELPIKTVNLIKSSQVITSLSSIVKELLENSIDAGATVINITLNNYGFSKLEVKDNGSGISDADIEYVAKPHYTSKIKSFEDLDKLSTYGFRGEALSSLCTVADLSITTKTKDSCVGHTYRFDHHGNIEEKTTTAANTGSTIVIRNLFKNIPVRKQYFSQVKRCKDELKKVEELAMSYAIIQPKLHLSVVHDRYNILLKTPCGEMAQVFYNVFQNTAKKLSSKVYECQKFKILLWLPDKTCSKDNSFSRSSTDRLFLFANCRPIAHKPIEKIIKAYYGQQLTGSHGRYPIGVFCLEISSDSIDVNLEPNKTRVLFKEEDSILNALEELLSDLYGKIEGQGNLSSGSKNIAERMDSLPCTFADIGLSEKKKEVNDLANRVNGLADKALKENECDALADVSQKVNDPNDLSQIENGVNDMSSQYKCVVETKIKNMLSSTQNFYNSDALAGDLSNFELGSLSTINGSPLSLQHSQNSNLTDESLVCTERPITDMDSKMPKEISDKNVSPHAHKSFIGTDGVPIYVVPAILNVNSANEFDQANLQSKVDKCQDTNAENMLDFMSEEVINHRVDDKICQRSDKLKGPQLDNDEESNNEEFKIEKYKSNSSPIQQLQQAKSDTGSKVRLNDQLALTLEKQQQSHCENDDNLMKSNKHISIGDDCWSRGHVQVDNKTIQNVKILTPPTAFYKKENVNICEGNLTENVLKRKLNDVDFGKGAKPTCKLLKKKDVSEIDESINYSSPVAKIETAFSLFAKDVRRIVLGERPGTDFTVVAQEIATRWKEADAEVKNKYEEKAKYILENLSMAKLRPSDSSRSTTQIQKKVRPRTLSKNKNYSSTLPEAKERPWLKRQLLVNYSLEDSKAKLRSVKKLLEKEQEDRVIGHINGTNGWIYCLKNSICCFNSSRLSEVLLFKTLLGSFSVPAPDLAIPIPFDASSLGDIEWKTLLQLNHTGSHSDATSNLISDKRILANGFRVILVTDDTGLITHGQIIGMVDCLQNYGLQDLGNICKKLSENSLSSFEELRPPAIQSWLKGEAIRMAKLSPHFRDRTVVEEKISAWQELSNNIDKHSAKCLHGKSIFTPLVSVDIEEEKI